MFDKKEVNTLISKYARNKKQQKAFLKRVSDRQIQFKKKAESQPVNLILK